MIIICPKCGMEEERSMDIQQVCQNCGTIFGKYAWVKGMKPIWGDEPGDERIERYCHAMIQAGMEWFDAHPDAKPVFIQDPNKQGYIWAKNGDAKALEVVILAATPDCSGSGFQHTIGLLKQIRKVGWGQWVKEMMR